MDAWETLIDNSSLGSGDAWDHLNAQVGGDGDSLLLIDGLEVAMNDACVDVEIDPATVSVEVEAATVEVLIDDSSIAVEICNE